MMMVNGDQDAAAIPFPREANNARNHSGSEAGACGISVHIMQLMSGNVDSTSRR